MTKRTGSRSWRQMRNFCTQIFPKRIVHAPGASLVADSEATILCTRLSRERVVYFQSRKTHDVEGQTALEGMTRAALSSGEISVFPRCVINVLAPLWNVIVFSCLVWKLASNQNAKAITTTIKSNDKISNIHLAKVLIIEIYPSSFRYK